MGSPAKRELIAQGLGFEVPRCYEGVAQVRWTV